MTNTRSVGGGDWRGGGGRARSHRNFLFAAVMDQPHGVSVGYCVLDLYVSVVKLSPAIR